jgi:hypothetical protein
MAATAGVRMMRLASVVGLTVAVGCGSAPLPTQTVQPSSERGPQSTADASVPGDRAAISDASVADVPRLPFCEVSFNSLPKSDSVILDGHPLGRPTPTMGWEIGSGAHKVIFIVQGLGLKRVSFHCAAGDRKIVAVRITEFERPPDAG